MVAEQDNVALSSLHRGPAKMSGVVMTLDALRPRQVLMQIFIYKNFIETKEKVQTPDSRREFLWTLELPSKRNLNLDRTASKCQVVGQRKAKAINFL